MKRYTTYLSILAVMLLMAPMAQARTVYIDVNAIKGDLTEGLRNRCKQVAAKDTAVLAFGAGTYTINGTIQCWCNAVIKGQGRDKTTVILDKALTAMASKHSWTTPSSRLPVAPTKQFLLKCMA